jgi:CelD/BcsL family acetyltransferase involved in cellulose biosynthesis
VTSVKTTKNTDEVSGSGVRITSPVPRQVWRAVLATDPNAVITQTQQWLECLCRLRGYRDASRWYQLPDGRILVLPLVARTMAGMRLVEESLPYGWGYGGVVVESGQFNASDAATVLADLGRRPVLRTTVVPTPHTSRSWELAAPPWAHRVPYLTQILDLDGGFDTVWSKRYQSQARRCVRKAERAGLEVRLTHGNGSSESAEAIATFTELYRHSVLRWAAQRGQPQALARLLARYRNRAGQLAVVSAEFGTACEIWSAYYRGEPIAIHVTLQMGEHSIDWLAASGSELARQTCASYLLTSRAIEHACRSGSRLFNMGESDPGSGVERYKAYFGAQPVRYHAMRLERLPLTPAERRLRAMAQRLADRRAHRSGRT